MLKSLQKCLTTLPKSTKTMISQHNNTLTKVLKRSKRSKPKRVFSGFSGLKSSFASMELSNQLELVFKFIDANDDGKISSNELSEFLLSLGHDKSKVVEESAIMLRYMDSNGDGYVDLNEYMNIVMINSDDNVHHDDVYEDGLMLDELEDEIMDAFHVFDTDKNGLISAKELKNVLNKLGFANCSIKECNLMIKGVDKDQDGFVNFQEFRLMMMMG